jgi:hypothetical protein
MKKSSFWQLPPSIKIYEALGAVADGRVELIDTNQARVRSSSGNKTYEVVFDPQSRELSVNDNGSYYQGYVGYPAIAYLMIKRILPCDDSLGKALKGVEWKRINQENKNDFDKTIAYLGALADNNQLEAFADKVISRLESLQLLKPKELPKPPSGW